MKFIYAIAAISAFTVAACSDQDGVPIVLKSSSIKSPSGRRVAIIESVDNGMGFGLGAVYDEIHITSPYAKIGSHGDTDSTVVFYAESIFDKEIPPEVTWISDDKLIVTLDPLTTGDKRLEGWNGLKIDYQIRSQQLK